MKLIRVNYYIAILGLFILPLSLLTGCSKKTNYNLIKADVILLDISSGLNAAGTFNEEDHSVTSLSSRAKQFREKLLISLEQRHAVYFGFVRKTYGQQQIETIISPKLIQLIDEILNSDVKDPKLREESNLGILLAWRKAIMDDPSLAQKDECSTVLSSIINYNSNGSISDLHSGRIASSLCANAQFANEQLNGLINTPDNIGSEIQAAIIRSLEKLSSDSRRLYNPDGSPITLIPNVILVSDLIQITDGVYILETLNSDKDPEASCKRAQTETANTDINFPRMSLISDGFASTKGNINTEKRDKLKKYWECWLEGRGFTDIDLGTRGINLAEV